MNIKWCRCPKCLGNAVDDGMDGIRCRRCGNLSIDECIEYAKAHLTPVVADASLCPLCKEHPLDTSEYSCSDCSSENPLAPLN